MIAIVYWDEYRAFNKAFLVPVMAARGGHGKSELSVIGSEDIIDTVQQSDHSLNYIAVVDSISTASSHST